MTKTRQTKLILRDLISMMKLQDQGVVSLIRLQERVRYLLNAILRADRDDVCAPTDH